MSEYTRRENNRDRVLRYLQLRGRAKNHELIHVGGMRSMARIHELQKEHLIDVVHVKGGEWDVIYRGVKPCPTLLEMMGA